MTNRLKSKISLRLARYGVALAFILGVVFSSIQIYIDFEDEDEALVREIQQILEVSQAPAARAVYVIDTVLAGQVADSLFLYDFVIRTEIRDDRGELMASRSRDERESDTSWFSNYFLDRFSEFDVPLSVTSEPRMSPGQLLVRVDRDIALAGFYDRAIIVFLSGVARNMILVLLLFITYHLYLTKPLVKLKETVLGFNPKVPKYNPHDIAKWHADTELGELNEAINQTAEAYIDHIDEEAKAKSELLQTKARLKQKVQEHEATIENVKTMKAEVEKVSEAKSLFLANLSHELRTPLNAIIGFSDLMLRRLHGPIKNQKYREYLDIINHAGSHLSELLNDLIDMSKIEVGTMELKPKSTLIHQMTEEVASLFKGIALESEIKYSYGCSLDEGQTIWVDPTRLKQVLVNVISNAFKYSQKGDSINFKVWVDTAGQVVFEVRDTGVGIPKDKSDLVFKPFAQLHHSVQQGAGIGLYLSKCIIELHGGKIHLESEEGLGTTVFITLGEDQKAYAQLG